MNDQARLLSCDGSDLSDPYSVVMLKVDKQNSHYPFGKQEWPTFEHCLYVSAEIDCSIWGCSISNPHTSLTLAA